MSKLTLLEFPCDFPLKVMGKRSVEFRELVIAIIERHVGSVQPERIEYRTSKGDNYVSMTVTVRAQSKDQLDDLYRELTACEQVLYVL
jgi:putative lipoic acid-binding regulatory protein